MFRVDTGQARTDLYGINKGAAQIIDLSPLRDAAAQEAARNLAGKKQKEKEDAARELDIQNQMAKMGQIKIMPKDQDLIAEKAKTVRDYVVSKNGMKDATPADMMEFQRLAGDLQMSANQSEAFRQEMDKRGLKIFENPDAYYPDNVNEFMKKYSKETAGDWNLDDTLLRPRYDSEKRISDIAKETKDWADRNQREYSEVFTPEQAKQRLKDEIATNEAFAFDMVHKFNNAEDKMGATTAAEYAEKLYLNRLPVNIRKAVPQGSNGGGSGDDKKIKIAARYNSTKDGGILDWEYITPPDNPYLTSSIGDVKPGIIHDLGDKTYMEVTTKPDSDGNYEKKTLGYEETLAFINNKLNTSLGELRKGKSPSHIKLESRDIKPGIKAGSEAAEKVRGGSYSIKGKTYTLKQLQDLGYTEEQVAQYKAK